MRLFRVTFYRCTNGRFSGVHYVATVACYNSGWSGLDDLQSGRHAHRSIINGDGVYVIGGPSTR